MRAIDRLRLWNQTRNAIKQVMTDRGPAAVERLLRQYPAAGGVVARRARSMSEVYPLQALLLTVALARCEAPETVDLLRGLAGRPYGWDRLGEKPLRDLRRHLVDRGEMELLAAVRQRLDDGQLAWILPEVGADDFLGEFQRVQDEEALRSVLRLIADFLEDVKLRGQPPGRGLDNATAAANVLWQRGRAEEALQLWTLVTIAEPRRSADPECLRAIAKELPRWVPRRESLRVEGLPEELQRVLPVPPVPPRVVRAADLLGDFPCTEWIDPLRRAWLAVDDLVRREARDEQLERDPMRLMAAQSLAVALGTCAALDPQMRILVRDEAGRKQRHEALGHQIDQRNRLVAKYNQLIAQHHAGKDVIDALRKQQDEIGEHDQKIQRAREALRTELTPAALLLHTLSDAQAFPLEVRQGAAWGLHRILEEGALEGESRERVRERLAAVLHDQELNESALRDRIAAQLPEGDPRIRELLVAAERYGDDRDAEELAAKVHRLAPEVPTLTKEIRDGVETSSQSRGQGEFGERMLRILPGARLLELEGALRRGLRWMVELVEGRTGGDPALEENLLRTASLVGQELPDVMDFLSRYPLRLMTLHRHRQILGQYSRDKVHIQFWTRYTPPRWFRGANPSELGEVHRRYLDLDDRSTPNAMGLYYRLFEHPALVLPVLYHEFMHYGGPEGDPARAIENETEVLLREVLFARHLLARLAPAEDAGLPAYEAELAAAIRHTELLGLAQQLFFDFEDDGNLNAINDQIAETYGEGLDAATAMATVEKRIAYWNRTIELENQIDEAKRFWCPEVDWPRLGTRETRDLTEHLRAVLSRALQQNHRLDFKRRDQVLSEPVCRRHRDDWSTYRRRPDAFAELSGQFAPGGLDRIALQAIVQRFELGDPGSPMSGILRLLQALAATGREDLSL